MPFKKMSKLDNFLLLDKQFNSGDEDDNEEDDEDEFDEDFEIEQDGNDQGDI